MVGGGSLGSLTGTLMGTAAATSTSRIGTQALDLPSGGSYLSIDISSYPDRCIGGIEYCSTGITIGFWVKLIDAGWREIFTNHDGMEVTMNKFDSSSIKVQVNCWFLDGINMQRHISTDETPAGGLDGYNYVMASCNREAQAQIHINGIIIEPGYTDSISATTSIASGELWVGRSGSDPEDYHIMIDDLTIWEAVVDTVTAAEFSTYIISQP